jgi:hypothetical protein
MQRTVQYNSTSGWLSLSKANVKVGPLYSLIMKMCRVNVPYLAVCRRVDSQLLPGEQHAVCWCPVVKLVRLAIQLSHQMLQLKFRF